MKNFIQKLSFAVALTVVSIGSVVAGGYPSKPITLWVGYGAGGTTDTSMRVLATQLEKELGVAVKVKNKGGGGGGCFNRTC